MSTALSRASETVDAKVAMLSHMAAVGALVEVTMSAPLRSC